MPAAPAVNVSLGARRHARILPICMIFQNPRHRRRGAKRVPIASPAVRAAIIVITPSERGEAFCACVIGQIRRRSRITPVRQNCGCPALPLGGAWRRLYSARCSKSLDPHQSLAVEAFALQLIDALFLFDQSAQHRVEHVIWRQRIGVLLVVAQLGAGRLEQDIFGDHQGLPAPARCAVLALLRQRDRANTVSL